MKTTPIDLSGVNADLAKGRNRIMECLKTLDRLSEKASTNVQTEARMRAIVRKPIGPALAKRLRGSALVAILGVCLSLVGCATNTTTNTIKVGACSGVPTAHESFALQMCGVDVDDQQHVWCVYIGTLAGRNCRVVVLTDGCSHWTVDNDHSGCEAPVAGNGVSL